MNRPPYTVGTRRDRQAYRRWRRRQLTIRRACAGLTPNEHRALSALLARVSIPPTLSPWPVEVALRAARALPVGPWRHGYTKHARDRIRMERKATRR